MPPGASQRLVIPQVSTTPYRARATYFTCTLDNQSIPVNTLLGTVTDALELARISLLVPNHHAQHNGRLRALSSASPHLEPELRISTDSLAR